MSIKYNMKSIFGFWIMSLVVTTGYCQQAPLYQSKAFTVYPDRIVQGKFEGKILSATEISSNYKSPANEFVSPAISFKFSINGKDNEMKSGVDHKFTCIGTDGSCETPLIKFGQQFNDTRAVPDNTFLKPDTRFTVRLDMRDVLAAFDKDGYYTTNNGGKLYKQDFKGVYVAGSAAPLSWDFDNLVNKPELKLTDDDKDGIYETSLTLNSRKDEKQTSSTWKQSKNTEAFAQYKSDYPVSDALYNLALEEMINAVEPDSTFRTGKEWAGVWTRDISYSIILSMAHMQPRVAKYSLMRKVKNGKIIQDTGTGGSYPASTDRIIWAVAAWELYKTTGDQEWLKQLYEIIKNTMEDDLKNAYDKQTGLFKGESSFLDWREQTYPKWMQPVDIYESECLGTNAVFYQANTVLSKMAALLNDKQTEIKYKQIANGIKTGVNKYLWTADKGYYGQFLYGRHSKFLSPRSEALGESLSVLFGMTDDMKARQVISSTPVMDYGIPCIYPQIPNIPPYHNNAVWPFVQSYYALAAAKAGNEEAVMESIAAIYRPAALWITNKENFVASNGDFAGTQINSSNMLWSLSGSIGIIHKLIFGIQFNDNNITFHPFVPSALKGNRNLTNFTYRNAVLNIAMEGYGNQIKSFTLDGKSSDPVIPASLKGVHSIKIVLANNKAKEENINLVDHYVTLDAPAITYADNHLTWKNIEGAKNYIVLKNGKILSTTTKNEMPVNGDKYGEYQIIAADAKGVQSFASEPIITTNKATTQIVETETVATKAAYPYKGFSGKGFVEINKGVNNSLTIPIQIKETGEYIIDFRYANGNGPTNTENKCAIRTVKVGSKVVGTIVMPQRGKDEWSNWGWSNSFSTQLTAGKHIITISFEPNNKNMNGDVNQAMIDYMRVIRKK